MINGAYKHALSSLLLRLSQLGRNFKSCLLSRRKKPFIWRRKTAVLVPVDFGKNFGFGFKNRNSPNCYDDYYCQSAEPTCASFSYFICISCVSSIQCSRSCSSRLSRCCRLTIYRQIIHTALTDDKQCTTVLHIIFVKGIIISTAKEFYNIVKNFGKCCTIP